MIWRRGKSVIRTLVIREEVRISVIEDSLIVKVAKGSVIIVVLPVMHFHVGVILKMKE